MKALLISLILPLAFLLTACGKAETPWVVNSPKPVELSRATDEGQILEEEFSPKLEIVFVIDNSASMEDHIAKLSANIDQFVDGFTKNTPFQYNVAVMSVYDHRRFTQPEFQSKYAGSGLLFDVGQFRPVLDRSGNVIDGKNFISSNDDDVAGMLKKTLKIGVQGLDNAGPEVEELFSPLAAAYGFGALKQNPKTKAAQNGFFFQTPNSYKVIFMVSDASDNSLISAGDLYLNLVARSNGDRSKVMGFGAISTGNCKRDPGVKNPQIEDFLNLSRPEPTTKNVISLCSNTYGAKFASFGRAIRKKILSQSIPLTKGEPDFSNYNGGSADECQKPAAERDRRAIVVCYGKQRIFLRTRISGPPGYRYNPETNRIRLDEDFEFLEQKGATLTAEYTPIHPESRRKGNVKAWGQ